ncbi:D-aminoacylase [Tissierella sp. MB52-C2]|uniref:N-acyl-D-amino-acid deacylase family protein n=1 Tax=Tissierella sp. MB52-C2 TaxID=3070999 RepID=UPI00280B4617|nr:D-aminoacylase [Tissierella sp. MB52-C2]WMM25050.1 D-aminoacylase [Tissierella sp. MB52-C2]
MKILIKNGLIVDGSLNKPFIGDILIEDNRIKKIGIIAEDADEIVDARERVISPGFIDTHSHSDTTILVNPYNEIKIRQGITTEILGQDGRSMAPLPKKYINQWRKINAAFNGDSDEIDWSYETTENYLNMMKEKGVGLNQGYLVPHGNIRLEAIGLEDKKASSSDLEKMKEITRREMKGGALGLSTGLIYAPCVYADTEELIEICKVVAEFNGIFAIHQRSEADTIIESMKEVIKIGRESGVKIHFSHFKVCGKNNWKYLDEAFKLLEEAKKEGIRVSFDQYPYVAGSTSLGVILPPWVHEGGTEKLLERLESKENRERIIKDIENGIPGWDNFVDFAGLDQIFITSVNKAKNKSLVGKNLIELGEVKGKDPYNATFDLIYDEGNSINMVDFYGLEEHIIKILRRPEHNLCTDGMPSDNPHPRLYGSFPRVLGKYVREEKALTLEEAIYKMTKKPAETLKIKDRGEIKEGYFADIVIFNLEKIADKGTYVEPKQYPVGIDYVIINGNIVINNGEYNEILAGSILRS